VPQSYNPKNPMSNEDDNNTETRPTSRNPRAALAGILAGEERASRTSGTMPTAATTRRTTTFGVKVHDCTFGEKAVGSSATVSAAARL
jgi:hypothetical protein